MEDEKTLSPQELMDQAIKDFKNLSEIDKLGMFNILIGDTMNLVYNTNEQKKLKHFEYNEKNDYDRITELYYKLFALQMETAVLVENVYDFEEDEKKDNQ